MIGNIDNLNKRIKNILKEQKNLSERILAYNTDKEELVDIYAKEVSPEIKNTMKYCNEIKNCINQKNNSLSQLNIAFMDLYFKAFYRIVHKRVETNYKSSFSTYRWSSNKELKNIWLNGRGIAHRPSYSETTCTVEDFDTIMDVLKKNPGLKNFVGKSKKTLFNMVYDCAKDWIHIPRDGMTFHQENRPEQYSYIEMKTDSDYGIVDVNIKKKKYLTVQGSSSSFIIGLKTNLTDQYGYYYGDTVSYDIAAETKNEHRNMFKGLTSKAIFVISQMNEEGKNKIKMCSEKYKNATENNLKLLTELHNNITPYLVIKAL